MGTTPQDGSLVYISVYIVRKILYWMFMSSTNVNLERLPIPQSRRDESWGTRFRRTIIASPGCWLIKFDYKSFHAVMMGFKAKDAGYIRLANLDIHAFLASHMINEPADLRWSDSDLKAYLADVRALYPEIRDKNAKQAILGWQLGMEEHTLFQNNRDIYPKKIDAKRALNLINQLFPLEVKYRQEKMMEAHTKGYLQGAYGYLRWFWDVYRTCKTCHYRNRGGCPRCRGLGLEMGEEAKEAISHEIQSDAHGHIKDAMLELHRQELDEEGRLVNQVHDDLQFDMPEEKIDELVPRIKEVMEFKNLVLVNEVAPEGLSVRVDVKIGQNLADMEDLA